MKTAKELFDFSVRNNYYNTDNKTANKLFEDIALNISKNDEAFFACTYKSQDISYAYAICFKKAIVASTEKSISDILFTANEKENREVFKNALIKIFEEKTF